MGGAFILVTVVQWREGERDREGGGGGRGGGALSRLWFFLSTSFMLLVCLLLPLLLLTMPFLLLTTVAAPDPVLTNALLVPLSLPLLQPPLFLRVIYSPHPPSPAINSSMQAPSPRPVGYGSVSGESGAHRRKRSSLDGSLNSTPIPTNTGRTHIRPHSLTDSKNLQRLEGLGEGGVGGGMSPPVESGDGESLPLLSLNAEGKGNGGGNSWLPRMFK